MDMTLTGRICCYIERALVLTGLVLLTSYAAGVIDAALGRNHGLTAFADARADAPTSPDQSLWSSTRVDRFQASLYLPAGVPQGVLQIPAINLIVPIFAGSGELALNRGVGHIKNTALVGTAGNIGIAGHRDGFFRSLKDLGVGDLLRVESLTGNHQYRVQEIRIVSPSEVDVLAPTSEAMLTLVTCYPFYFVGHAPQRYIVRAALVDQQSVSQMSRLIKREKI